MGILSRLTRVKDGTVNGGLSNSFRSKRFHYFEQLVGQLPAPVSILDVGGTTHFWEQRGWAGKEGIDITLVNLAAGESPHANIRSVAGDATNLEGFENDSFDVVFSNSVIEHLFTWESQLAMARECQRVGRALWVQTPNYWFPIEPHFHWLGWHWYPRSVRVGMIKRVRCGHRGPCPDPAEAAAMVDEVRLMTRKEMVEAFPGSTIWPEKIGGMTKSWVAIDGFE